MGRFALDGAAVPVIVHAYVDFFSFARAGFLCSLIFIRKLSLLSWHIFLSSLTTSSNGTRTRAKLQEALRAMQSHAEEQEAKISISLVA